jgi:hypothetical protein
MSGIARPGDGIYSRTTSLIGSEAVRDYEARRPNPLQLARLAQLTGAPAAELAEKSIAHLKEDLPAIPGLFGFELVCGQVVKVDPVTGLKYPVAGATVNVYDVDCDWLWFFPPYWPWSWGFRFPFCVSELIETVATDACGYFCVLVPRWDIDWIRVWIEERWCFPEILRRPSVGDVLAPYLKGRQVTPPNPPDPASLTSLLDARADLAGAIGSGAVAAIRAAASTQTVGAPATGLTEALAANAFAQPVPAPVPAELRSLSKAEAMKSFASRLGLRSAEGELDLAAPYGPFLRCIDVEVPVWVPFFTVPDITFQVTQDIGGTQEVIYDGAFDVNWAASAVNVELDASPAAVASPFPGCPTGVICEDEPAILQFGYLDVDPAYLDPNSGFAILMNKPNATPDTPSSAPVEGVQGDVPLFGCAPNAPFYRVLARYADNDGLTAQNPDGTLQPVPAGDFGPQLPLVGPAWQVSRIVGGVPQLSPPIVPDAEGWYSTEYLSWDPPNLLIPWNPASGVYQLTVQTGEGTAGSVTVASTGPTIPLVVDNSPPVVSLAVKSWNYVGGPANPFMPGDDCLLIERTDQDIEINIAYAVTATHLYSVSLVPDGCAAPNVTLVGSDPAADGYTYDGPFDNSLSGVATYRVSAGTPDGCYTWTLTAWSRAFNPNNAGDLIEQGGSAWNTVDAPIYVEPSVSVAIVTV